MKRYIFITLILVTSCSSSLKDKYVYKPDELAVIVNKPLIIPKKFELLPPATKQEEQNIQNVAEEVKNISQLEEEILAKTSKYKTEKNIDQKIEKDKKPNILKRIF